MRIPVYRSFDKAAARATLVGATDAARTVLDRIRMGDELYIDIDQPRNYRQLKTYWVLCDLVSQNHETLRTKEQVDYALRILTGHCEPLVDPQTGEIFAMIPKRLRYRDMDQAEWEEFFRRAKDVVLEKILKGIGSRDLENEIAALASR